jgi:hypothetical protein
VGHASTRDARRAVDLFLSVPPPRGALIGLCGHWHYAHVKAVHGDQLNAEQLGLRHIVSEDAVHAALKSMDEPTSQQWLRQQILKIIIFVA